MGLELDRGLYAPLIIEDPHDPVCADVGATLMLDDWLGGYGRTLRRDRHRARRRIPDCRRPRGKAHIPAEAVLRTSSSAVPPTLGSLPTESKRRTIAYGDLVVTDTVDSPSKTPDRRDDIILASSMGTYDLGIGDKNFPDTAPIEVRQGERLRLKIHNNNTMMFHPIHVHGHTFQRVNDSSAKKDTVNVLAMTAVEIDINADNRGQWTLHCHNTYPVETGMSTLLS